MKKIVTFFLILLCLSFGLTAQDGTDTSITGIPESSTSKTASFPVTLDLASLSTEGINAGFLNSEVSSLTAAAGISSSSFSSGISLTEQDTGEYVGNLYFFYYAKSAKDLTLKLTASETIGTIPWSVSLAASGNENGMNGYSGGTSSDPTELTGTEVIFTHTPLNSIASYACYKVDVLVEQKDYLGAAKGKYEGNLTITVSTP